MEERKIIITVADDDYTITSDLSPGDTVLWLEAAKSHVLSDLFKN